MAQKLKLQLRDLKSHVRASSNAINASVSTQGIGVKVLDYIYGFVMVPRF